MTFENIVAKTEIVHNEQFLLLLQCFQLIFIIKPLFMEILRVIANIFSHVVEKEYQFLLATRMSFSL